MRKRIAAVINFTNSKTNILFALIADATCEQLNLIVIFLRPIVKIIKEKRKDTAGFIYRFVCISKIKNNTLRRLALISTLPLFFLFNCLAMLPIVAVAFIFNNITLFETIIKRWNKPMDKEEA